MIRFRTFSKAHDLAGLRIYYAIAAHVHQELLDAGSLIHRPPHPALGHVLRISAVDEALVPGRLAALELALS